ncbi:hypothetical protein N2152v2_007083, partial [Parachlorella kessleri]
MLRSPLRWTRSRPLLQARWHLPTRTSTLRSTVTCARQGTAPGGAGGPPKPNPRFGRQDLRRIKQQGPSVEDLYAHIDVEGRDNRGETVKDSFEFVPPEVLGPAPAAEWTEPGWGKMAEMPFMEFYQGLRQRNWTSPHYDAQAEPWTVQFYKD